VALAVSFGMALAVGFGAAVGAGFCPCFERGKGIFSTNPSEAVDSFSVTDYQAEDIHTHPHLLISWVSESLYISGTLPV